MFVWSVAILKELARFCSVEIQFRLFEQDAKSWWWVLCLYSKKLEIVLCLSSQLHIIIHRVYIVLYSEPIIAIWHHQLVSCFNLGCQMLSLSHCNFVRGSWQMGALTVKPTNMHCSILHPVCFLRNLFLRPFPSSYRRHPPVLLLAPGTVPSIYPNTRMTWRNLTVENVLMWLQSYELGGSSTESTNHSHVDTAQYQFIYIELVMTQRFPTGTWYTLCCVYHMRYIMVSSTGPGKLWPSVAVNISAIFLKVLTSCK